MAYHQTFLLLIFFDRNVRTAVVRFCCATLLCFVLSSCVLLVPRPVFIVSELLAPKQTVFLRDRPVASPSRTFSRSPLSFSFRHVVYSAEEVCGGQERVAKITIRKNHYEIYCVARN